MTTLIHSTADSTVTNPPAATTSPTPTTSPPATASSASAPATTTLPSVTTSLVPPDLTMPPVPTGFVPVNPKNYSGHRPSAAQVTAVPDAVLELESTSIYATTFGDTVPDATKLASDLANARQWSELRVAIQGYLVVVKSNEAISWKTALSELDALDSVFQAAVKLRPAIGTQLPALQRLLDVPKVEAQRANATRARTKKAKAATAASATNTTPTSNAAAPAAQTTAPAPNAGNVVTTTHS